MQITWPRSPSSRRRAPTAFAVCPPMPASTSSKTSVRCGVEARRSAHDREHHARELAARGDLAQRPGGHAGVRGDHELDRVGAARAPARASLELDLEARVLHRQRAQLLDDRLGEPGRRLAAGGPQRRDVLAELARARWRAPRSACSIATSAPVSSSWRARARGGELEQRLDAAAVLSQHAVERLQARFDGLERRLDARHVQLARSRRRRGSRAARRPAPGPRWRRRAGARRGRRAQGRRPRPPPARRTARASSSAAPASRLVLAARARRPRPPRPRVSASARRSRSRATSSRSCSPASGRQLVDLAELELEQAQLALAVGGQLCELLQVRAELPDASRRAAAQAAQTAGVRRAAQAVEDLQLGAGERSACGARAGRRRTAAAPPASRRSATLAARPLR